VKSIQINNGDIVLTNGSLTFVQGSQKLIQSLTLWLTEPMYGNPPQGPGFTTPAFGSHLLSFIGTSNFQSQATQIKSEVFRILTLFQQNQIYQLQHATTAGGLSLWNKSEVIKTIDSVEVIPPSNTTLGPTTVSVLATIHTLSNTPVTLNIAIDQNGITVN
jgi:hypothetical protein